MSMMRPRLLLAPYHPASGSERGLQRWGLGKAANRRQALRAPEALVGSRYVGARELLINAAAAEGIRSIATVHDSFGCLPAQAERFRRIIKGVQFIKMYEENDVLTQVLNEARKDLGDNNKGLPAEPPKSGSLDIQKVPDAEFAFA
jgi:DNA-directed RNA polymerase